MARAKKKIELQQTTVADAVESAFSDAEALRIELESWYDNLPESFQNGSKGEALQEAMSNIENAQQPDVPSYIESETVEYFETTGRRTSRRDRLDSCIARLQAAADLAREKAGELEALEYNEQGKLSGERNDAPDTEDERNNLITELEAFADECESAVSDWESVEFPGMYG